MLISSDCYAHSDDLEAATTLTAEVALALAFEFGSFNFAKESLGLTEIIAVVKANNTQSIKSFIKAGFEEIERLNDEKKIKYKLNFD